MIRGSSYDQLMSYMNDIIVFDTHEHLEPLELRLKKKVDVFNVIFSQYISSDLVSSGMRQEDLNIVLDEKTELEYKWNLLAKHLPAVQNMSTFRIINYVLKDIFGIDELNETTYRYADRRIKSNNTPDLYDRMLKNRCNIEYCLWDNLFEGHECPLPYVKPVFRVHDFIFIAEKDNILTLEMKYNAVVDSLHRYIALVGDVIAKKIKEGYVALKNGVSYFRKLYFDPISREKAEKIYIRLYMGEAVENTEITALQDYIMHQVVLNCYEMNIPMQIHTGIHAGNGNIIKNSNPADLANIFLKYPCVRFDIFHGGYPYGGELSAVAKNFPNVFIDLCWTYSISPRYCERYLDEWLDTVPLNKLMGFGGDYLSAEMVYGQLKLAKETIARVLSQRVEEGIMSLDFAENAAYRMLYQNAADFYRL